MSIRLKVEVTGDKKLSENLEDSKNITDPTHKFLQTLTKEVVGKVTRFTPVETGLLRATWKQSVKTEGSRMFGVVSNDTVYAKTLELAKRSDGTSYRPKKPAAPEEQIPFLAPAVEWVKKNMDIYAKDLKKDIEKEFKP